MPIQVLAISTHGTAIEVSILGDAVDVEYVKNRLVENLDVEVDCRNAGGRAWDLIVRLTEMQPLTSAHVREALGSDGQIRLPDALD